MITLLLSKSPVAFTDPLTVAVSPSSQVLPPSHRIVIIGGSENGPPQVVSICQLRVAETDEIAVANSNSVAFIL